MQKHIEYYEAMLTIYIVIHVYCHCVPKAARPFSFCTSTRRYLEDESVRNSIRNINELSVSFMMMKLRPPLLQNFLLCCNLSKCYKGIALLLKGQILHRRSRKMICDTCMSRCVAMYFTRRRITLFLLHTD